MTYNELLDLVTSQNAPALRVDSRSVKPGDIFIAVKGSACDGHDFIPQALANGAKYIVFQKNRRQYNYSDNACRFIGVPDSAKAAAQLAQASKANPASKLVNLAVTGTNGKTTVAFLVSRCIRHAGKKCGLIGTVIYDTGEKTFDSSLTTPDCFTIADMQHRMLMAGSRYMVIEASSHALSQNRLLAIDFTAAAFTNLTGDHLDYHLDKQNYLDAKTNLFRNLSPGAVAVLNRQSPEAQYIAQNTSAKIIWYAIDAPSDLTARIRSMDVSGTAFVLEYLGKTAVVNTPLLGLHNISNHLAAAGLCLAAGFDLQVVAAGLSSLKVVPGRLDMVDFDGDFTILVDYAHTDDALKNVLGTLKPLCKARLILVFGCGGDRDRTKRPRMARVAEELADSIIVTSDNPRTENPNAIISEIVTGFRDPNATNIVIEPDRKKAIGMAIETARKGDIILIAGKGHETYQVIGTKKFDFSDKLVALDCLGNIK